ncbi:MAG: flippase-like domain-containing protein, partial [Acidobacteriaceae bacterium]|nr:flippase-like domain-containing protein [Acidobacteriaceae bacterium]
MKTNKRFPTHAVAVIAGLGLLAFIVERAGLANLMHSLAALRWTLLLIIAVGGVGHALRTLGWRLALGDHRGATSFLRLTGLRLAAEAGGQLGFVGQMFGDTTRITLLRDRIPVDVLISSVTWDRGLFMVTGAIVSAAGVAAATFALPLPHGFMVWARMFVAIIAGLLLISAIVIRKRFKILSATARLMSRQPGLATWIEKRRSGIHAVEEQLTKVLTEYPLAFWTAFLLNLGCHLLAVLEVYMILFAFGLKGGWLAAFSMEALTKVINVVGALNPGNIGTYEGANMLMLKFFGVSAALGLTFAAARRLRALFWAAVGSIFPVAFARVGKPKRAASRESTPRVEQSETTANGHFVSVVVANEPRDSTHVLSRVGTVPVLLRAILSLHKSAADRIFVLVDQTHGSEIRRVLMTTGRVPKAVEWVTTPTGTPLSHSLQDILTQTTAHRVVVVSGARTYHPAVVRKAVGWHEHAGNLVLNTEDEPVGIYSLSNAFLLASEFKDLTEVDAALARSEAVTKESVERNLCHRIATINGCAEAERKLDQWLVKPTDGLFARMNRIVSIPVSRQLIRFPITPNMVSLFILAVSLSSGVLFA